MHTIPLEKLKPLRIQLRGQRHVFQARVSGVSKDEDWAHAQIYLHMKKISSKLLIRNKLVGL